MSDETLADLQRTIRTKGALGKLSDYQAITHAFLDLLMRLSPPRFVSRSHNNYVFYQYGADYGFSVTRPLNTDLMLDAPETFDFAFERFMNFLGGTGRHHEAVMAQRGAEEYIASNELHKVIYTMQQAVGSVADSLSSPNMARKLVGESFQALVKLIILELGVTCAPRTIKIHSTDDPGYQMSYQLDVVFSRDKIILTAEQPYVAPGEIVGSIKTTSKDRLDKIFLDKYLLHKSIGWDVPVVALFLHDVQRQGDITAQHNPIALPNVSTHGTFKSNHFLHLSIMFQKLDGVYYVDPLPMMVTNRLLREQIKTFQEFLVRDLWTLSQS